MKILFPFVGDSVGGSHLSTIELCKTLKENGYDVIILLHDQSGPLASILRQNDLEYTELKTCLLAGESPNLAIIFFGMIWNVFPFFKFIKKYDIDLVHGNDLRINLSWSIATKLNSTKYIWHQRTILSKSLFWKFLHYLCDYFIASSQVVLNSSPGNIPKIKKSVVYNAFDTSEKYNKNLSRKTINRKFPNCKNKILLGYIGRLVDYKNVDFLIKSLPEIIDKSQKSFHLLIIGKGSREYMEYLKKVTRELNLVDNISFLGFVDNPSKLISGLDVLIASSGVDAFGRTIVESMLQSTPVLAANKGGHLEILEDGKDGLFYEMNCKSSLIEKIAKLVDDSSLRDRLVINAYKKSSSTYTKKNLLTNILNIYKSLI